MTHTTMTSTTTQRETLLLTALTSAAALAFTYVCAVRTPIGQALDTRAMLVIASHLSTQTWTATLLGLVTPLSVAAATLALAGLATLRSGHRSAFDVVAIVSATVLSATVLKDLLVRPEFLGDAGNSLPSGHVAAIAGLTLAAATSAPPIHRAWVAILGVTATGLTGIAVIAQQWHRPSDVLAAALVAAIVGALVATLPRGLSTRAARAMRAPEREVALGRSVDHPRFSGSHP